VNGADPNELGAFLRARRAEMSPERVGLPTARQSRRVPGLRREEVAQLAMISTDYYTRLEQGTADRRVGQRTGRPSLCVVSG
jgi:Helix-turn-helix domain